VVVGWGESVGVRSVWGGGGMVEYWLLNMVWRGFRWYGGWFREGGRLVKGRGDVPDWEEKDGDIVGGGERDRSRRGVRSDNWFQLFVSVVETSFLARENWVG